jgi:hypothetical protein
MNVKDTPPYLPPQTSIFTPYPRLAGTAMEFGISLLKKLVWEKGQRNHRQQTTTGDSRKNPTMLKMPKITLVMLKDGQRLIR